MAVDWFFCGRFCGGGWANLLALWALVGTDGIVVPAGSHGPGGGDWGVFLDHGEGGGETEGMRENEGDEQGAALLCYLSEHAILKFDFLKSNRLIGFDLRKYALS
ncbi:MAG: hypothetical protein U9O54_04340 [Chloroflexota bacterium]|nr:hypothetical protein [Chloroflexota bacterium]